MKGLYKFPLLFRNIGFSILSDFFLHLGNTLVLILISRKLGSAAAGSFNIGNTYFFFGTFLAYWGFGNLMTREVAKDREKFPKYFSNFGVARLFLGTIAALLVIGVVLITPNYSHETKLIVVILALGLPANSLANLCQSGFFSFERFEITGLVSVIVMAIKLTLTWVALGLLSNPLVSIAVITLATTTLTLLIFLVVMNRHLPTSKAPIDTKFILMQIKIAFPFFLMAIFMATDNRIDILLISRLLNTESVGYYSAMTAILGVLYLFPDALRNAVLPALARYRQTTPDLMNSRFRKIVRYSLLLTIPIAFLVYLFSDVVLKWVYGEQFGRSAVLLRISIGSLISYSVATIFTRLIVVEGKVKWVTTSILISAVMTVVLNFLLIKPYGLQGVAFVKLATSVLLLGLLVFVTRKQSLWLDKGFSVKWILLSGILMVSSVYFLHQDTVVFKALICQAVYVISIIIFPVFSRQEKQAILKGLHHIFVRQ